MSVTFLSRFTPSMMDPDALESIFVQREALAREILERISQSLRTPGKGHTLLVGSRGVGKTHLISIISHRVRHSQELAARLVIAWLREEEWGVNSVLDLLLRTLRAVAATHEDPEFAKKLESLYGLAPEQAEREATAILRELVGDRILLVFAENLDDLFKGLGDAGQFRLRNYLNDNPFWMFVATAQSLWNGLLRSTSPFYNFFHRHLLEGLSLEDTCLLLSKIAQHTQDGKLAAFLTTPLGRSRVKALKYLSGGNHRVCIIFSQFITRESLEDLVEPLVRTIDDLTPYYQSRIVGLPPEQRKILEWMCERRSAVSVPEVAQRCFFPLGTAVSQLEALRETGYVHPVIAGRDKYYELREPLMRLSIEVKKHRGEPIRLLVEFLGLWYSPAELKERLAGLRQEAVLEREYGMPALRLAESGHTDPRIAVCSGEYNRAVEAGDFVRALRAVEELTVIRDDAQDWLARAICLIRVGNPQEALGICGKMLESAPHDARGWALRASLLHTLGHHQMALDACETALELDPEASDAYLTCAEILETHGRYEEAIGAYHHAIALDPEDPAAHFGCGVVLSGLGRFDEALGFLEAATTLDPENARAFVYQSAALIELKRLDEALVSADAAIARAQSDPLGWVVRGTALTNLSQHEDALGTFRKALRLGDDSSFVHFKEAELLLALQRWREAGMALDAALLRFAHAEFPDAGNTTFMVRSLTDLLAEKPRLRLAIKLVVLIYRKHRVLRALAQGLVDAIPAVAAAAPADRRLWRDLWQEWAVESEFTLAFRLLNNALAYLETSDPRVLLELPLEERLTLEPLLGVRALESA